MATRKPKVRVFLVWFTNDDSHGYLSTITYHGGNGLVRVYYRDKYDSRVHGSRKEPLAYFANGDLAKEHMQRCPGIKGICQVNVSQARKLGFKKAELSGEVEYPEDHEEENKCS